MHMTIRNLEIGFADKVATRVWACKPHPIDSCSHNKMTISNHTTRRGRLALSEEQFAQASMALVRRWRMALQAPAEPAAGPSFHALDRLVPHGSPLQGASGPQPAWALDRQGLEAPSSMSTCLLVRPLRLPAPPPVPPRSTSTVPARSVHAKSRCTDKGLAGRTSTGSM